MQSRRVGRLCLALAVLVAILGFAGGAAAAGNTLRLDPATTSVANGATLNIKVVQSATVVTSGSSASIVFNKKLLQVTSVTRGSAFASAPLFLAGDAAAIAAANKTGKLQNVAAAFFPPTSVAAGEQEFITVGFKAIACGTAKLTVPTGRVDATMLDGRTATYGANLKITTTGATVTVCEAGAGASVSVDAGASVDPNASIDPNASASTDPNASASTDPNTSASAAPAPGASAQPGAGALPSAPPANDASLVNSTAEQSGWLNFAIAALAVAAAGLATLVIVLTLIAIAAAVVGTIVVIRVWRRYGTKEATASVASVAAVDDTALPSTTPERWPADRETPVDRPTQTGIPLPTAQP